MSSGDNGYSATDIITYIGIPLAVLGVLPILYNTVATLAALSKVKRMLRHSRLTALTRSDVVNRVIEVELPRYAVTPWDRFNETSEYWRLPRQPSQIPGGSWTTLNWKTRTIGIKTQRLEYADQLRQPQVDVAFDELVSYLLDLGAVPVSHGWKLLRSGGLWTPMGCPLMTSLDGQNVLTIAPLDDSDGHLSLAVNWSPSWTTRDPSSLPPYWLCLPPGQPASLEHAIAGEVNTSKGTAEVDEEPKTDRDSARRESLDSIQKQGQANERSAITCQIATDGLIAAFSQATEPQQPGSNPRSLYIEHLRIRPGNFDGVWFATAATAYGTTSQTVLWNYKISDTILEFARRDSVPCGVLVLLGMVDESQTPEWSTTYNIGAEVHDLFMRRTTERHLAMQAEAQMSPAEQQIAVQNRIRRESEQTLQDMRDKQRLDSQRRELRTLEALQSPKWDTKVAAEHALRWLKAHQQVGADVVLQEAVGTMLHRMILDGQFSSSLCKVLDVWKTWSDNGGMRKSDYLSLQESPEIFAQAILLVAITKEMLAMDAETTLAVDLQECLKIWRTVRLG